MNFEKGYIYHIYNQGNNKGNIFFNRENYLFFLKKMQNYILPYSDILAWCLMPNHFHLMVLVNFEELLIESSSNSGGATLSSTPTTTRSFNHSIGIMLASYTRAINKQEDRSGALFRETTKAVCLNSSKGISPAWFTNNGITQINISNPEKEYPRICFDYIHQNPVKAGFVKNIEEWEFSSASDHLGIRNGKIINKNKIKEYV
jgi:putative transposase